MAEDAALELTRALIQAGKLSTPDKVSEAYVKFRLMVQDIQGTKREAVEHVLRVAVRVVAAPRWLVPRGCRRALPTRQMMRWAAAAMWNDLAQMRTGVV